VDDLQRDLLMAGAGTYAGPINGSLVNFFAPILPYTVGSLAPGSPDAPDPSAITIMYVPDTNSQTTIRQSMPANSAELKVLDQVGCPADQSLCGFDIGMRAIIFDQYGGYDVFTVTQVQDNALHLQHRDDKYSSDYDTGSWITEIKSQSYYLNRAERRLYYYDAYKTNLPLVDNVVDLRFDYFGEAQPPLVIKEKSADPAEKGPFTTYGPPPPSLLIKDNNSDWPQGENCTFKVDNGLHVPRLENWLNGSPPGTLVPIPYARLNDGPWCPGATNSKGEDLPSRYDADLLRVRQIRVTVRVQVGPDSLRGQNPQGRTLFVNPGTSRSATGYISDQEIRFDITPRNMNIGR
jgi:hypothetical protein